MTNNILKKFIAFMLALVQCILLLPSNVFGASGTLRLPDGSTFNYVNSVNLAGVANGEVLADDMFTVYFGKVSLQNASSSWSDTNPYDLEFVVKYNDNYNGITLRDTSRIGIYPAHSCSFGTNEKHRIFTDSDYNPNFRRYNAFGQGVFYFLGDNNLYSGTLTDSTFKLKNSWNVSSSDTDSHTYEGTELYKNTYEYYQPRYDSYISNATRYNKYYTKFKTSFIPTGFYSLNGLVKSDYNINSNSKFIMVLHSLNLTLSNITIPGSSATSLDLYAVYKSGTTYGQYGVNILGSGNYLTNTSSYSLPKYNNFPCYNGNKLTNQSPASSTSTFYYATDSILFPNGTLDDVNFNVATPSYHWPKNSSNVSVSNTKKGLYAIIYPGHPNACIKKGTNHLSIKANKDYPQYNILSGAYGHSGYIHYSPLYVVPTFSTTSSKVYDGKDTFVSTTTSMTYNGTKTKGSSTATRTLKFGSANVGSYSQATMKSKGSKITFSGDYSGIFDIEDITSYIPTTFTITKRSITPTITATNKQYDGTDTADVKVSFNNMVAGETLVEGTDYEIVSAKFNSSSLGTGKTVTAEIRLLNTTKANNYSLSKNTATTTASITKKSITPSLTSTTYSKTYDGNTTASKGISFSGLNSGDSLVLNTDYRVTSTFSDKNVGNNKTITTKIELLNTTKANKYSLSTSTLTSSGTITKKSITPVVGDITKVYDKNTSINFNTSSLKFSGLVAGESLTYGVDYTATGTYSSADVGTKSVSGTVSLNNTAVSNNYTLSKTTFSGNGTITKSSEVDTEISYSINDNGWISYDRDTNPPVISPNNSHTIHGYGITCDDTVKIKVKVKSKTKATEELNKISLALDYEPAVYQTATIDGDAVIFTLDLKSLTQKTFVGNSYVGATLYWTGNENYEKVLLSNINIPVTTIKIKPENDKFEKVYNGANNEVTARAVYDGGSKNGKVVDDVSLSATADGWHTPASGSHHTTDVTTINGNRSNQYEVTGSNYPVNIQPKPLDANITLEDKIYNGNTVMPIENDNVSLLGLVDGDNLVVGYVGDNTYNADIQIDGTLSDKNVGNNKDVSLNVTVNPLKDNQDGDVYIVNNYDFSKIESKVLRANILPRPITPKVTVSDKNYDGSTSATVTSVTFDNIVQGETLVEGVDYRVVADFDNADTGTDKTVTAKIELLDTTKANNYTLTTGTATTTASITKGASTLSDIKILNQNNVETTVFSFKDTLRITGKPTVKAFKADNLNKVEVYIDDSEVATVDAQLDKSFTADTILHNLSDINPGIHKVKIRFTGDSNVTASEFIYLDDITINPIPVTSDVSISKTYNGTTVFEVKSSTVKDKETEEKLNLSITANATLDSKNTGARNILSTDNIVIIGDKSNHYSLASEDVGGVVNITKKSIEPISATVEEKLYDDDLSVKVLAVEFDGLVNNEDLTINKDYTANGTLDTSDVGQNKDVAVKVTLEDSDIANNYYLSKTIVHTNTNIDKSTPRLEIEIGDSVQYGEQFNIRVTPKVDINQLSVAEDTVAVYNAQGEKLGETSTKTGDTYELTITADKKLKIGDNRLSIVYGGSNNFLTNRGEATIKLTQKPIDVEIHPLNSPKEYDGNTEFEIELEPKDTINNDTFKVTYNKDNKVNVADKNATKKSQEVTIDKQLIQFIGDSSEYYTIKDLDTPYTVDGFIINPNIISLDNFRNITKPYDKNTTAYVNSDNYTIVNQNTDETLDINIIANYDTPDVGTNKTITITPTQNNSNYKFSQLSYTTDIGEITKSNSQLEDTIISNSNLTYGDVLNIKVEPDIKKSLFSISAPYNKVELVYDNNISIAQGDYNALTGKYELEYDTTQKLLPIGNHNLKILFGGSDNYKPSEKEINITLKPKDISANYILEYQYDNIATKQTNLNLEKIEPIDKSTISKVPATLELDSSKLNAGDKAIVNNITYTLNTPWYKLSQDNITGGITILKADMDSLHSKNVYVSNKLEKDYNIDISEFLPTLIHTKLGTVSFTKAVLNETVTSFFKGQPTLNNNNLTISANHYDSDTEQEVATLNITVSSQNYNDFIIPIILHSTNKPRPLVSVHAINELTYGQDLTNLKFNVHAVYNNQDVQGKLVLVNPNDILDAGDHLIDAKFIPNDYQLYDEVELSTLITVNKAIAQKIITPEYERPTTQQTMSEVKFIDNGEFIGYDGQIISTDDYEIQWTHPHLKPVYLDKYEYRLESNNYYYTETIPLAFDLSSNTEGSLSDGSIIPVEGITSDNGLKLEPNETIVRPDGSSILFPTGGEVDNKGYITGDYITVYPDGLLKLPSGTVISPNGNQLITGVDSKGDIVIYLPTGTGFNNDILETDSVYYPQRGELSEEIDMVIKTEEDTYFVPTKNWVTGENTVFNPDNKVDVSTGNSVKLPNGATIHYPNDVFVEATENSTVYFPYGGSVAPSKNGSINIENGVLVSGNGITLPDGTKVPEGNLDGNIVHIPNGGTVIRPNGDKLEFPTGTDIIINADGSIDFVGDITILPNGDLLLPDGGIIPTKPKAPTISIDGDNVTITVPSGVTIKHPEGDKNFTNGGNVFISSDNEVTYTPNKKRPLGTGSKPNTEEQPKEEIKEENTNKEENKETEQLFKDMDNHWSKTAVEYLYEKGIINGYPDGTFSPNDNIIRGDLAIVKEKTISHLNYKLKENNTNKFTDINPSQYYYEAIQKLASTNLLTGYPDGTFKPNNVLTREESFVVMSKFIDKYCLDLPITDKLIIYKDYNQVADWAKPYLNNLKKYGIVLGDENGNVNPKDKVTRAELCQMIYKVLMNSSN